MTRKANIPTGPFMTFQAIPYPVPESAKAILQQMSYAIKFADSTGEKNSAASALEAFTKALQATAGVELTRREFMTTGRLLEA